MAALILAYPNSQDTFVLDTDASDNSVGAELCPIQNGKVLQVKPRENTAPQEKNFLQL